MIFEDIVSEPPPAPLVNKKPVGASPLDSFSTKAQELEPTCLEGFNNPVEFLAFFNPEIREGIFNLHKWQVEIGEQFGIVKPTGKIPFRFCLCAANGSGKDLYVIAPFVLWFICCKVKSVVIITSSSAQQLSTQTERHIANLANHVNNYCVAQFGEPILNVRQRRITCTKSGSEVFLFATDEAKKAEGYHPETGREMAIIVNEAKSVTPDIFDALGRCGGYNYWLNVSTPGEPKGFFYNSYRNWEHKRKITYHDCPHLSELLFEEEKKAGGLYNPVFRSKWLAEFTFVGGKTVITAERLQILRDSIKLNEVKHIKGETYIGIDLAISTHGDETVISVFNGNKQTKMIIHHIKDAITLAQNIDNDLINTIGVKRDHGFIALDDGGVGHPIIDILKSLGWTKLRRVLNNHKSRNPRDYRNRGAEMWYKLVALVDSKALIFIDDNKLYDQLMSRKYKDTEQGLDKLQLEDKKLVKGRGEGSPDRADASVLAISMMDSKALIDAIELVEDKPMIDNSPYARYNNALAALRSAQSESKVKGNPRGSINAYIKQSRGQLNYRN